MMSNSDAKFQLTVYSKWLDGQPAPFRSLQHKTKKEKRVFKIDRMFNAIIDSLPVADGCNRQFGCDTVAVETLRTRVRNVP